MSRVPSAEKTKGTVFPDPGLRDDVGFDEQCPGAEQGNVSGLGRLGTGGGFGDVTRHAEHRKVSGLLVVRPNAELFLANVEGIRAAIVAAASEADPPARAVLLDLESTGGAGTTGPGWGPRSPGGGCDGLLEYRGRWTGRGGSDLRVAA